MVESGLLQEHVTMQVTMVEILTFGPYHAGFRMQVPVQSVWTFMPMHRVSLLLLSHDALMLSADASDA